MGKYIEFWKKALKRTWHNISRGQLDQIFRDIKSWWHYRHDAWRDVLTYKEGEGYVIERTTISTRDVQPDDLPIRDHKYLFFDTELEAPFRQETRKDVIDGVEVEFLNTSASSNYLYMVNNDINDALAGSFKKTGLDPKVMLVLLAVAGVFVIYFMFFR